MVNYSTYDNSIFDLIDNTLSDDQMELTAGDISEYECKLAIQQMQNSKAPSSDGISVEFYKLNENRKLDNLGDDKIKGILLRSKAEWIECSEKPTDCFANLEKKRVSEKNVKLLRNKDGKLLKNNKKKFNRNFTLLHKSLQNRYIYYIR